MWNNLNDNITGVLSVVADKAKKWQEDLEGEMDAAVGNEEGVDLREDVKETTTDEINLKVDDSCSNQKDSSFENNSAAVSSGDSPPPKPACDEMDSTSVSSSKITTHTTSNKTVTEKEADLATDSAGAAASLKKGKKEKEKGKNKIAEGGNNPIKDTKKPATTAATPSISKSTSTPTFKGISDEEVASRVQKAKHELEQELQSKHTRELDILREKMQKMKKQYLEKLQNMEKKHTETLNSEISTAVSVAVSTALSELTTLKDGEIDSLKTAHAEQLVAQRAAAVVKDSDKPDPTDETSKESQQTNEKVFVLEGKLAETDILLSTKEKQLTELTGAAASFRTTIVALENEITRSKEEVTSKEATITDFENQVTRFKAEIQDKAAADSALDSEVSRYREVVKSREAALETAACQLSDSYTQNEELQQKVSDLSSEIAEKDMRIRELQSDQADESDMRKQILKYQEQSKQTQDKLAAYEQEGKLLAKKQSNMEQTVKNRKKELQEKEKVLVDKIDEIKKLKGGREEMNKVIHELQEQLKKYEQDANSSSKSLSAMAAVGHKTTEKIGKLESEITAKAEELASQRRALENAWNDVTEGKRTLTALTAERDDLRKQLGEGTSKVMETESTRREIEQREAVLKATNQQLQDSLQRQMADSSVREERLRDEVHDMRKRWQEAITSRETMASDLTNASAPLLMQISALQDSLRTKSENWQGVENNLSERALRAEKGAEVAEHKRAMIEEQLNELKKQCAAATTKIEELTAKGQNTELEIARLEKIETSWIDERAAIESKLSYEISQRQTAQSSLREMELRHKLEVQSLSETASLQSTQKDVERDNLNKEINALQGRVRELVDAGGGLHVGTSSKSKKQQDKLSHKSSSSQHHGNGNDNNNDLGALPSGNASFAASEQQRSRSNKKDDDIRMMQNQIDQLQVARNALLDEVSYLSNRNSELEEQSSSVPGMREERAKLTKQVDVLLEMLGEKEEELEALVTDMQEVKTMYKDHMADLMDQVVSTPKSTYIKACGVVTR